MLSDGFPQLPTSTETRDALHAYCRVLGGLRGQLSAPHPRWWHISLEVEPLGFTTGPMRETASGRVVALRLDCDRLVAQLLVDGTSRSTHGLADGVSPAALGVKWVAELAHLGFAEAKSDVAWAAEATQMRRQDALALAAAFRAAASHFADFRQRLSGEPGPVQLWPHHLDLSFEWFGRDLDSAGDESEAGQAQIGCGFSTGDQGHPAPYFYANPWPFDDQLVERELPAPATWHTGDWSGSLLPYDCARDYPPLLLRYLEAVYTLASPGLS